MKPFPRNDSLGAFTLIEVLAGLAILSSVLVGVVLARSEHSRQWIDAQHRLEAIEAADKLASTWWSQSRFPAPGHGTTGKKTLFHWRTTRKTNRDLESHGVQPIRLELFDSSPGENSTPIIHVDFLLIQSELE